mmetsp:Transcript_139279/g.445271  ORF Transcript_139279/g.445271 Transcript_139279/m.445271 type:complete len:229 (+) Transcript_139279:2149-2835(+)
MLTPIAAAGLQLQARVGDTQPILRTSVVGELPKQLVVHPRQLGHIAPDASDEGQIPVCVREARRVVAVVDQASSGAEKPLLVRVGLAASLPNHPVSVGGALEALCPICLRKCPPPDVKRLVLRARKAHGHDCKELVVSASWSPSVPEVSAPSPLPRGRVAPYRPKAVTPADVEQQEGANGGDHGDGDHAHGNFPLGPLARLWLAACEKIVRTILILLFRLRTPGRVRA